MRALNLNRALRTSNPVCQPDKIEADKGKGKCEQPSNHQDVPADIIALYMARYCSASGQISVNALTVYDPIGSSCPEASHAIRANSSMSAASFGKSIHVNGIVG
jgi:hypothetical protein